MNESYKLCQYSSYDEYLQCQTKYNAKKKNRVWVRETTVVAVANHMRRSGLNPEFGICHGVRSGYEQILFMRHLPGCVVLGTEIAPTASEFQNTIEWDFHNINPEWESKADFVYSNSLDHAYDPEKALDSWTRCLKPSGLCFIEWGDNLDDAVVSETSKADPFHADSKTLISLITHWGIGKYSFRGSMPLGLRRVVLRGRDGKKRKRYITVIILIVGKEC